MKLKQAMTGIAALACMTAAHAQSAGTFYVTTGWLHLAPQSSSQPLKETSVGGSPVNVTLPNTGASLDSADTLGFTAGYFVTDHIATEFVIGVPPKFNLDGSGAFSSYGKLGSVLISAWVSPMFRSPTQRSPTACSNNRYCMVRPPYPRIVRGSRCLMGASPSQSTSTGLPVSRSHICRSAPLRS
jgi:hypothetical protein